jgi:putative membrane protein
MPGFIPFSRGSFMLDLVAVAMFAVLPAVAIGVNLVKNKRNFESHKKVMLGISLVLGVAVFLFELEMRMVGWKDLAEPSPYFNTYLFTALGVHLVCSISTTFLLSATVLLALRKFPNPPGPNGHSSLHKTLGGLSATGLMLTSVTGWTFYYMAFIAS